MSFFNISLDVANKFYIFGWRLSIAGAIITALGVGFLMWGTRIRDQDSEQQMANAHIRAGDLELAAGQLNVRAAELEKEAAQLRLDLEKERKANATRVVPQEAAEAIIALKGIVKKVLLVGGDDHDSVWLKVGLQIAFQEAGIEVVEQPDNPGINGTGLMLYLPHGLNDMENDPLYKALSLIGGVVGIGYPLLKNEDPKIPAIFIGHRPPNFVGKPLPTIPKSGDIPP